VLSVTFNLTQMATGSVDHTIKIWRLADGVCLKTLIGHGRGVWCLRFVTDILLLSGSYDCNIKVKGQSESISIRMVFQCQQKCKFTV